jgi:hypothetical protein
MPKTNIPNTTPWGIGYDALSLLTDMSLVIGLRAVKVAAGGPAAQTEITLMFTEKLQAAAEIHRAVTTGMLGQDIGTVTANAMAIYAPKVRANRKRLTKD